MFCKNCGKKIGSGETFCQNCGQKLDAPEPSLENPEQNKSYSVYVWVGIVVIILIIFIVYSGGSNNSTSDSFKTSYKSSFIQSCEKTASSSSEASSICECSADYMVNNYTDAQLTEFDTQYESTGQLPQTLKDAISNNCISGRNANSNSSQ